MRFTRSEIYAKESFINCLKKLLINIRASVQIEIIKCWFAAYFSDQQLTPEIKIIARFLIGINHPHHTPMGTAGKRFPCMRLLLN